MLDAGTKIIDILAAITKYDQLKDDLDIALFEEGLLDSMGLVEFLVEIEGQLGIEVAITEFDRDEWSTPNNIVAFLLRKIS